MHEAGAAAEAPPRRGLTLRGAAVVLSGQVGAQTLGFARNLIVARLIPAADFGVAATFAVTMALLQMLGDLSLDKLLVQARDGGAPRVQATAQAFQALRGVLGAAALFVLAAPIASLFEVPETTWAFRALALVPLIRGFAHLDVRRMQRDLRFGPSAAVDALPPLVATLAAWPLAVAFGDYRVALVCVLLQEAGSTALSHVLAERRYAWAADREIARRILAFGGPLVLNALLMFGIFQGDRVVVGTTYGPEILGAYSLAFLLATMPTILLAGAATSLVLPTLSPAQDDPPEFRRRTAQCAQALALAAVWVAIPLALGGGALLTAAFGTKYSAAVHVVPWLAAMQALRILRVAPTLAALARGDSAASLWSNAWRSSALIGMAAAAALGSDLVWIAISGLGGELLAMAYSAARLSRRQRVPARLVLGPAAFAFGATLAAVAVAVLWRSAGLAADGAVALALSLGASAALLAAYPELREAIHRLAGRPHRDAAASPVP